jgi:hypothetical protein
MAIPVIVWGIIELVLLATTAYEIYDVLNEFYEGLEKYNKSVEEAKAAIKKQIQALKDEIDKKIEEKEEVGILLAMANGDRQSPVTKKASGRGAGSPIFNNAIEQKIPFRKVISMVCDKADNMPVLQLRKKKGVKIEAKDIPKAKRKVLEELLKLSAEELLNVDLEQFVLARLKQLAANLMFEFIDDCLDWHSPLKCEVSFGPPPKYADHPVQGTKLRRDGKINPFYPAPHRSKGSISADLIIPDYRKKPCNKDNVFAIVEIKFQNDTIEERQFKQYEDLLAQAAKDKTTATPARFDKKPVSSGGRLSLFRYPEDRWPDRDEESNQKTDSKDNKSKKNPKRNKRG